MPLCCRHTAGTICTLHLVTCTLSHTACNAFSIILHNSSQEAFTQALGSNPSCNPSRLNVPCTIHFPDCRFGLLSFVNPYQVTFQKREVSSRFALPVSFCLTPSHILGKTALARCAWELANPTNWPLKSGEIPRIAALYHKQERGALQPWPKTPMAATKQVLHPVQSTPCAHWQPLPPCVDSTMQFASVCCYPLVPNGNSCATHANGGLAFFTHLEHPAPYPLEFLTMSSESCAICYHWPPCSTLFRGWSRLR